MGGVGGGGGWGGFSGWRWGTCFMLQYPDTYSQRARQKSAARDHMTEHVAVARWCE